MTFLFVMNLGFAWGAVVGPVFKPAWAKHANFIAGPTSPATGGPDT